MNEAAPPQIIGLISNRQVDLRKADTNPDARKGGQGDSVSKIHSLREHESRVASGKAKNIRPGRLPPQVIGSTTFQED